MNRPAGEATHPELILPRRAERSGKRLAEDRPNLLAENFSDIEFAGLVGPAEAQENHLVRRAVCGGPRILASLLHRAGDRVSIWRESNRGDIHAV